MTRSSKNTKPSSTIPRKKTKKVPRVFTLTVVSNELPMNTQVKILNFLKNMNEHIQKVTHKDLQSFADKNPELLSMKLNGNSLKNILKKTNENHFRKFQEFMDKLKTVNRKTLSGGSSTALVKRNRSRNNSPKENNKILDFIKSVNVFLDNSEVRGFIIKISILLIFLSFVAMVSRGLFKSNKPIELPELGENTIITLGITAIIGAVVITSVKTITGAVIKKQEIQQHMQEQYLQTVNNSAVTYGARGFAAMPGQFGMPMMQGPYNIPRMPIGY